MRRFLNTEKSYNAVKIQLQYSYNAVTMQSNAVTMQLQYSYNTITMHLQSSDKKFMQMLRQS